MLAYKYAELLFARERTTKSTILGVKEEKTRLCR